MRDAFLLFLAFFASSFCSQRVLLTFKFFVHTRVFEIRGTHATFYSRIACCGYCLVAFLLVYVSYTHANECRMVPVKKTKLSFVLPSHTSLTSSVRCSATLYCYTKAYALTTWCGVIKYVNTGTTAVSAETCAEASLRPFRCRECD